ncbi:uncharacterized protein LOC123514864 [Portunus trituberculatus]|uniref:uncharacterized protein LOC123514864 n=1 Tax=Portunus trituberculatus TaxID=210409 RepID=UPI001E1D0F4C|nr:uncharacterized protein LOC123514864 [Portunus trituberculatus]
MVFVSLRRDEWLSCTCSLGVDEGNEDLHFPDRTCCTGGVTLREVPLCIPAQHFIEDLKMLQIFKKGVAHTLCCTPSFWRSSGTLHTAFINVCRVQDRVARMEDASTFTTSLVHAFFFLWKVVHTVLIKNYML